MRGEVGKDFYCSADSYSNTGRCCFHTEASCSEFRKHCGAYHRKWPSPEQFKEEYGEEYPKDGAVYWSYRLLGRGKGGIGKYETILAAQEREREPMIIICACTPFGSPPEDWRPQ